MCKCLILAFAALLVYTAHAQSQTTLVIENEEALWQPYVGKVLMREPDAARPYAIAEMSTNPHHLGADFECSRGAELTVQFDVALYRETGWKICQAGQILFMVQRRLVYNKVSYRELAQVLLKALNNDDLRPFATSLAVAIDNQKAGEVAFAANELLGRASEILSPSQTSVVAYVAQESAARAAVETLNRVTSDTSEDRFLVYDPTQSAHVLTAESVDAIKAVQEEAGLPITGEADWHTLQTLSGKEWNDLATGYGLLVE